MISYAQNFEDVLLARVFAGQDKGFYIDVGACDPVIESVTKHFHDLGWRGINIEPLKVYFELLQKDRPQDINLNMALGAEAGERTFFNIGGVGLSTFVEEFAVRGERWGYAKSEEIVVITTLKDVCDAHVQGEIDFLKIDVEGWERQVIEGGDWATYRPKLVIVEATEPNSQVPNFKSWESILLDADYLFTYFDGLNRFYVRKEDRHLKKFFRTPVSWFDDFQPYSQIRAERQLAELTQDRDALKGQLADRSQELEGLKGQLESIINSRSWRYTRIIRNINARVKRWRARPTMRRRGHSQFLRILRTLVKAHSYRSLKARPQPAFPQQVLWFDVGDLLWWPYDRVTGIQRTLLSVLCELRAASDLPFSVRYCRYVSGEGFFEADDDAIEACITRLARTDPAITKSEAIDIPPPSRGRLKAAIRNVLRKIYRRVPAEIAPQSRELFFAAVNWFRACRAYGAKKVKLLARRGTAREAAKTVRGSESIECTFSEGDVLLNIGSSWVNPGYIEGVQDGKHRWGVKYVAMIYDLIPWKLSAFFPNDTREQFISWCGQTVRTADLLLTISENSKADIQDFMQKEGVVPKDIEVIRLGEKPPPAPTTGQAPRQTLKPLKETGYVLSVGTLEIRKDHDLLFRLWSQLLEKYGDDVPMMVWVGRWGWLVESLQQKIRSTNSLDGKLLVLASVSEEELDLLYRNCLFTVFPSQYEGWGLPVAESIAHGKYCVASNSSSIPEVAGDLIDYHDPGDFKRCYELVERAIFDSEYRKKKEAVIRAKYRPHSWADCRNTITKTIESLFLGGTVDLLGLERPPTETGITG